MHQEILVSITHGQMGTTETELTNLDAIQNDGCYT